MKSITATSRGFGIFGPKFFFFSNDGNPGRASQCLMASIGKVSFMGSGPMGIILSSILAEKFPAVDLYLAEKESAEKMHKTRLTRILRKDYRLPDNIQPVVHYGPMEDGGTMVVAIPSRELEETME